MKELRFLLLSLVICFANGVKAQFYDSADDIYYYVETSSKYEYEGTRIGPPPHFAVRSTGLQTRTYKPKENEEIVQIFNFDGLKGVELTNLQWRRVDGVKRILSTDPSHYEDKVESLDYRLKFVSSSYEGTTYEDDRYTYTFSPDRNTLVFYSGSNQSKNTWYMKRVDKSYFKVGRSRTPSGTMHE